MTPASSDPIRNMFAHNRGYAASDLLNQSIALCAGFCFLEQEAIDRLCAGTIRQEDFERAVYECLSETDAKAAASFQEYSQTRLPEDTFRDLFLHWVQFSGSKSKLCRLTDRMVYPHLSRVYQPDLAVPPWLERLACELLPDSGGTFYDGTAGAGNMALRIAQRWREKKLPLRVSTSEINPLLFHLSVLRAKIHGFEFQQTNANCLYARDMSAKADISVMFPPLRGGEPIPVSDSVLCGSDWSYAYHQLNALKETGVGVCRIPNGALFNAKNQAFREYLLDLNVIDAVITLPKSSVPFWTAAPATSLVVFRRGRRKDDAVRMMELSVPDPSGRQNEFSNTFYDLTRHLLPLAEENGRLVRRSELDAFNLLPQRYLYVPWRDGGGRQTSPLSGAQDAEAGGSRGAIRLGEAAKIYRGINVAGLSRCVDGAGVLRLSDVQNGRICVDSIARYDLSKRENTGRYRIQAGDILISCKGKAIKLCVVPEDIPLLLSHDFLGIRADSMKLDPWYLYYVLQSPAGQQLIQQIQMGSSITMIRAADLERLKLYYIPLPQQIQYASELHGTNTLLEEQLAALDASRRRAYEQFYQKIGLEDT